MSAKTSRGYLFPSKSKKSCPFSCRGHGNFVIDVGSAG